MAQKKYYVVWDGFETGIFDSWEKCKLVTKGFPQAKYKSFKTFEIAKEAFSRNYYDYTGKKVFESELTKEELAQIGKPNFNTIAVDAACSGNPGVMEYQGVNTRSKEVIFKMGPFDDATNNIGEFLALVHALALMKQHNDNRPIYSDSKIAINWVTKYKKCNSQLEKTAKNTKVFKLINRAEKWINENSFKNKILKWETKAWGEIPADFGRK